MSGYSAAISAGISAGGSFLSSLVNLGANKRRAYRSYHLNKLLAEHQQKYSSAEAQKNRDWQENMASTAHQRQMQDMKKAGLNPMLAFGASGAAVGSGASATSSAGQVGSGSSQGFDAGISEAVATAMQMRTMKASVAKLQKEGQLVREKIKTERYNRSKSSESGTKTGESQNPYLKLIDGLSQKLKKHAKPLQEMQRERGESAKKHNKSQSKLFNRLKENLYKIFITGEKVR